MYFFSGSTKFIWSLESKIKKVWQLSKRCRVDCAEKCTKIGKAVFPYFCHGSKGPRYIPARIVKPSINLSRTDYCQLYGETSSGLDNDDF